MMKYIRLIAIALGLVWALGAAAQGKAVKLPNDLRWQTMDLVGFNFNFPGYEGTPAQRGLAQTVWKDVMDTMPLLGGKKAPIFIITTAFETEGYRYVFSSLRAAGAIYPVCQDPPNSSDPATPIYAICPMRVVIQNKADGKATQQDFPGYCTLTTNDQDQPKSRNYVQVAMGGTAKNAYVRVVQYGKPAPECNRVIRLP